MGRVIDLTEAALRHRWLRTHKTKGAGSRAPALAMAYNLLDTGQARWRCVNRPTWSRLFAPARPSWTESKSSAKIRGTLGDQAGRSTTIHNSTASAGDRLG